MIKTQIPNVKFVEQKIWENILQNTLNSVPDKKVRDLTISILGNMHSHHVGITPELAMKLACAILGNLIDDLSPWDMLPNYLYESVTQVASKEYTLPKSMRPIFSTSIGYSVFQLILPLIDFICRQQIGSTILFSYDPLISKVTSEEYQSYSDTLKSELIRAFRTDSSVIPNIFSADRALTLYNIALQKVTDTGDVNSYPDLPLPDLDIFLNLRPATKRVQNWQNRRIQIHEPTPLRDPRQHDAGFEGISLTTNLARLQHMLPSEHIYPTLLKMDRIFNSGYMVLDPPPKPIKQRDALIVALMPELFVDPSIKIFLKTAWFDFLIYIANILRSNNLIKSELRWVEGDHLYRMRFQNILLSQLEHLPPLIGSNVTPLYRHIYLRTLNWLPRYLDKHTRYNKMLTDTVSNVDYKWWFRNAWTTQRDDIQWEKNVPQHSNLKSKNTLDIKRFKYTHIMLFLPMRVANEKTYLSSELASLFRLSKRNLSITWVPEVIEDFENWGFSGRSRLKLSIDSQNKIMPMTPEELSGTLIDAWIEGIMKEMQYG